MRTSEEQEIWPRLTRFYGIGPSELAETPRNVLRLYVEMLPTLEAEEHLARLQAADFPHISADSRQRIWRRLERQTRVVSAPAIDVTQDKSRADLQGIGIKVVMEDA